MALPKQLVDQVLGLLDEGLSQREVGRRVGCTHENVGRLARKYRPQLPTPRTHGIVPRWAYEVREDYRDHAAVFGEEAAARHCRRLLAEARAQERHAA